jgi:hypothetical protein
MLLVGFQHGLNEMWNMAKYMQCEIYAMRGGRGGFTQMRIYGDAKSGSQTFFIYDGGDNSLLNNGCHLQSMEMPTSAT